MDRCKIREETESLNAKVGAYVLKLGFLSYKPSVNHPVHNLCILH